MTKKCQSCNKDFVENQQVNRCTVCRKYFCQDCWAKIAKCPSCGATVVPAKSTYKAGNILRGDLPGTVVNEPN